MIDEYYTWIIYGYHSYELSYESHKPIVARCDDCCQYRILPKYAYRELCSFCGARSEESRRNRSEARMGIVFSDEHRHNMSIAQNNRARPSEETRMKSSASKQGIPYEEWEGFSTEKPYCEKFDEACRERIREKYNRKCFLCNTDEEDNKQKLSVHHYDMNKMAGCDGVLWKLVPLCRKCHGRTHSKIWCARIEYLLENVWDSANV